MTVIKSRRFGWTGHVERMGQKKIIHDFRGKTRNKKNVWKLWDYMSGNIKTEVNEIGWEPID
jgi:hypothetical protein